MIKLETEFMPVCSKQFVNEQGSHHCHDGTALSVCDLSECDQTKSLCSPPGRLIGALIS